MPGKLIGEVMVGPVTRFQAVVYDLLYEETDAIVNAANGGLSHGGGVAAAIADAAGPDFVDECNALVQAKGRIATGDAVATSAGRLKFKGVIHAVGPRLGDGDEGPKIESALSRCFTIAERNRWRSLSFPPISSGIFAVPIKVCAGAYVAAVRGFFRGRADTCVELVRLCVFDGPVVAELRKLL